MRSTWVTPRIVDSADDAPGGGLITFMAPDLPTFSGGLKVIDAYVRSLNENGLPARVWHGTERAAYADATAPTVYGLSLDLDEGDVLVIPETGGQKWQFLTGNAPVVMLCQGTDFVFANTDFTTALPGPYPGWPNATAVVGVSESIVDFLGAACDPGFPIHHVPVEIDTDLFRPLPKEKRLAFMPRRRREDLLAAVQLIRASGLLEEWRLEVIDAMTAPQVADSLGRSAIFLFGAEREGVGLPGAEAMAAGAYVIGYTGHGAREYLLPEVSTVIPESDVIRMRDETIRVARLFDADRAWYDRATAAGRDLIVARYCHDVMAKALVAAFTEITAPGSPSLIAGPATFAHYQRYGPKPGRFWQGYVAARTYGGRLKRRAVGGTAVRSLVDPGPGVRRDLTRTLYGVGRTVADSLRQREPIVTRWSTLEQRWHYRWPEGRAVDTGRWRDAQGWATRGHYYGMSDLLWREFRPGPGDVVLDLGAGTGGETFYLAGMVGTAGRVIAVEASPSVFELLNELAQLNEWRQVQTVHAAITSQPGPVTIEDDVGWVGNNIFSGSGTAVMGVTIDDLCAKLGIDHVDWIKMNIEGAEREALLGMERMAPHVSHLTISCHDFLGTDWGRTKDFVLAWLQNHGFTAVTRDEGDFVQALYVYAWR